MNAFFRLTIFVIIIGALSSTAQAGTRSRCQEQLSAGGWSVSLSGSYNTLTLAPLAACVIGTGGMCLGGVLTDLALEIGIDLAILAFRNMDEVVNSGGMQTQGGICSKDYKNFGVTFTDYYFYVRHRNSVQPPEQSVEPIEEYVARFYASWGYPIEGNELAHWIAHHVNVGRAQWLNDAHRNIIQRHYWEWQMDLVGDELTFWQNHLGNVGRNKWLVDQRKNVIQKLFWACGGSVSNEPDHLEHWFHHSYNVSHAQFKIDVGNDFRCHH